MTDRPSTVSPGSPPSSVSTAPPELPRVLGLFDGIGVVIGSMIGSGIFLKVGNVDQQLQGYGFGPILGVWVFVGLLTLAGSLALAELAAMFPHAGGPYLYLREAYGRPLAFLWGWTEFWVVRTGSVGALACATALYLNQVVALSRWQQEAVAIGIVVVLSIANILSTRGAAAVQNIFTVIKLLFLTALIVVPFLLWKVDLAHWTPWLATSSGSGTAAESTTLAAGWLTFGKALGLAFVAVMWPYDGWINLAPVAEDLQEPQRNVPRALGWGLVTVIVVYVGAILSYHAVLPMSEVAASKTVAADVFGKMFGGAAATLAAVGVACSTFGATNSNMLCGPRIYLAMARDGLLPAALYHVHGRWQTPANAVLAQSAWTILLIVVFYAWKEDPKGAFDGLTDSVICAGLLFYSLTVAAVYVLRVRRPDLPRPYRAWGYPWAPAVMIAAYAFTFVIQFIDQWQQTAGVLALIGSGVVYYAVVTRSSRPSAATP
jgi:basic amino acid/polyamine antiporter, APA family